MRSTRSRPFAALLGMATAAAALLAGCARTVSLDQGWSPQQVKFWYEGGQGSRLIPQAWLLALEQPDRAAKFLDKRYIEHFRFLTTRDALPLGFVPDVRDDRGLTTSHLRWRAGQGDREPWVGMTCSACHTSDITYRGRTMRVEGGATHADFQGFLEAFNTALVQTRDNPAKFDRFAGRVLGHGATAADRQRLKTALRTFVDYQLKYAKMNQTGSRYGYGRNDAFGYIFNKAALVDNPEDPTANEPNAPVSYPFLWNVSQHRLVQWNGMATNSPRPADAPPGWVDEGALGRNVGEVIGVFGDVSVQPGAAGPRYHSSTNVASLVRIEQELALLRPPLWPHALFPVNQGLAAEGKGLYQARCAGCHAELRRTDLTTRSRKDGSSLEQITPLASVGTDPTMVCNVVTAQATTGLVAGAPTDWGPMPPRYFVARMLVHMVRGVLADAAPPGQPPPKAAPAKAPAPLAAPRVAAPPPGLPPACAQAASHGAELAYKARPLTGAWATGPFLHNGSVPTLYDLLLPPAQRPAAFSLGTREFDPERVGFVTAARSDNDFQFDTIGPGNSNQGHDYGNAGLSDRQRRAIVEYLKVIGE